MRRAQTGRYACVPGLSTGRLRLPPVLTGLAARLRHSASRAAVRRHRPAPGIGSVKNGQPDGRCPAKVPVRRGAPGSSRGAAAHRQAHRAAPPRNLRLSGAAYQWAQRRTDTLGAPSPRAALPSASAALAGRPTPGSGPDRQDSQHISTTCKCGNSHGQKWPSARAGWVTRRQSHWTDEAGVCPGDRLPNVGSASGIRVLPAAPAGARCPIRTHIRRPKRPPLLCFPAVLAVLVVRISFLTWVELAGSNR